MPALSESLKDVEKLVERFRLHLDSYKSKDYKEERLKVEFINPFFEALGWDVRNVAGYAEAYKEVIFEDSLKTASGTEAPDYCFRIGGVRKFFVETKKPSVDIKGGVGPAYQLRRYAWSAKLPLSILTDFEEFAIYDCRIKPSPNDRAGVARVFYCTFHDYLGKWDFIYGTFARESILRGSFDRYVQDAKKRGTQEVDDAFLVELERWRELLARDIAKNNPTLSVRELNFCVQRTIDRVIFLRMCEDREIEPYGQLRSLENGTNTYHRLCEMFYRAEQRYNSDLFNFKSDALTPTLVIGDRTLKEIFKRLYYPDCPYEFSVIGVEILGHIYERFLGKVVRLTPAHRVKVEEKPEVRKAGGVYYTPTYIVDYIVKNTVGRLCEGKSPDEIAKLRILDPACGSGSFLIGAYDYLLDYHRKWYAEHNPERLARRKNPPIYRKGRGRDSWELTTRKKKEILLNNIYGVDIDPQAVEVTKLSLSLKVLEGESGETLGSQLKLFHERALPELDANIKCGNSLIGSDFYDGVQLSLLDDEERYRINAFDWEREFPEIMTSGGFDVVIGNPPYIRIQMMKEWAPLEVEFYKKRYASASKGNYDIYVVFVERGLSLLNERGRLGFICPHKFFNAKYGESLRGLLSKGAHLSDVVHFGDQQVFKGATTYTCLLFLDKGGSDKLNFVKVDDLAEWRNTGQATEGEVSAANITAKEWNFVVGKGAELFEKLNEMPVKLEDVTSRIFQGVKTGADKIYIVEEIGRDANRVKIYSRETDAEYWLEADLLHPLVKGGDSRRYSLSRTSRLILFPYVHGSKATRVIPEETLRLQYPLTWKYFIDNKRYLEQREHGKLKGLSWYGYTRNQALDVIALPKIITPDIAVSPSFSIDRNGDVFFTGGVAGGYGILVLPRFSQEFILGLLNCRLTNWIMRQSATQMRGGYYSYESRFIRSLPIRTIDFSDKADKARHDRMVALVEQMLELHKKLRDVKTEYDRSALQRQITSTDKQIDALVYELYGLTDDEIRIVEESAGA